MARLRYNGLVATLGGSLTNSATSVTFGAALTHGGGTLVPTISGTDYIPLTILDSGGLPKEIVYLTAYTSNATTGTIARGKEGTSGVAHSSGVTVVNSTTALDMTTFTYRDASDTGSGTVPASQTQVAGMSLTIPYAGLYIVSFGVIYTTSTSNNHRFSVYANGAISNNHEVGSTVPTDNSSTRLVQMSDLPVDITADGNTIQIAWSASGGTTAVTYSDRWITARLA